MKKPPDPPDWQYDESTGLFVDFHDPEQVVTYDELQNTDVREEERTVEALGISADDTVIEYGAGTGASFKLPQGYAGTFTLSMSQSVFKKAHA